MWPQVCNNHRNLKGGSRRVGVEIEVSVIIGWNCSIMDLHTTTIVYYTWLPIHTLVGPQWPRADVYFYHNNIFCLSHLQASTRRHHHVQNHTPLRAHPLYISQVSLHFELTLRRALTKPHPLLKLSAINLFVFSLAGQSSIILSSLTLFTTTPTISTTNGEELG